MRNRLRTLLIPLTLAGLLITGSLVAAAPWLRRIHSVSLEEGIVVIETSPSGRRADPNRDGFGISVSTAVLALGAGFAVLIPLVWLVSAPIIAAHFDDHKE